MRTQEQISIPLPFVDLQLQKRLYKVKTRYFAGTETCYTLLIWACYISQVRSGPERSAGVYSQLFPGWSNREHAIQGDQEELPDLRGGI